MKLVLMFLVTWTELIIANNCFGCCSFTFGTSIWCFYRFWPCSHFFSFPTSFRAQWPITIISPFAVNRTILCMTRICFRRTTYTFSTSVWCQYKFWSGTCFFSSSTSFWARRPTTEWSPFAINRTSLCTTRICLRRHTFTFSTSVWCQSKFWSGTCFYSSSARFRARRPTTEDSPSTINRTCIGITRSCFFDLSIAIFPSIWSHSQFWSWSWFLPSPTRFRARTPLSECIPNTINWSCFI